MAACGDVCGAAQHERQGRELHIVRHCQIVAILAVPDSAVDVLHADVQIILPANVC